MSREIVVAKDVNEKTRMGIQVIKTYLVVAIFSGWCPDSTSWSSLLQIA